MRWSPLYAVEIYGWSGGDIIGIATLIASFGITLTMGYNHAQSIFYKWEREKRKHDLEDEIMAMKARDEARHDSLAAQLEVARTMVDDLRAELAAARGEPGPEAEGGAVDGHQDQA